MGTQLLSATGVLDQHIDLVHFHIYTFNTSKSGGLMLHRLASRPPQSIVRNALFVVLVLFWLAGGTVLALAVPSVTDGGHTAGFYWKPTAFWFSNEQFTGDDSVLPPDPVDQLAPTIDLGLWYMWNHPVLRSYLPGTVAGLRTGIGFVEYRDSYTATGVGDADLTYTHYNTTIQVPIEAVIGIGGDRALWYLGLGSGFSWVIEGPYSNLQVSGDETPYLDDKTRGGTFWPLERSTAPIYTFALGSILEIGERWVFEPRFVLNGTLNQYAQDFDNTTHTMGISFGFGRRFGE